MTKKKKLIIIILAVVVVGLLIWRLTASRKKEDIETFEVQRGTVREELILSGEIKADEHAGLAFQTSGELSWLGVSEGEEVEKGQVLARLDTANLYATYERAVSDLRSAQATLDRVYDEVSGYDEDESWDQREDRTVAEVARDKAYRALTITQKSLANANLKAPFDGVVTAIVNPFSGINTLFSQSQIEIVNPETIYFEVTADQSEVINFHKDQKVLVVLDSFPDEELEGEIKFVAYTPKTDEIGTVYKIKVSFSNADFDIEKFRIGMSGDAKFILSQKEDVLYVPPWFINSDKEGKYVLGRREKKIYVEVGIEGEERVEVTGDLSEGDTIYD